MTPSSHRTTVHVLCASHLAVLGLGCAGSSLAATDSPSAKERTEACIAQAALHHRVNPSVLRAILRIESGLDPRAVGRNADGSVDVGIAQINSRHFGVLARYRIRPEHLLDACVGAYVAAWHLASLLAAHGNTWSAIARYHSATPNLNHRYQVLLANELIATGAIPGKPTPVPALHKTIDLRATQPPARTVSAESLIVFDQ